MVSMAVPAYEVSAAFFAGKGPSEAAWQAVVCDASRYLGWTVAFRVEDAVYRELRRVEKTSAKAALSRLASWPDLVLIHPDRRQTLFVEVKTDKGKLTEGQKSALATLAAGGLDVRVWRPKLWDDVLTTLQGGEPDGDAGIAEVVGLLLGERHGEVYR
jgi:hypothetical protein